MNGVGKRQRRKPSTQTETSNNVPRKWSEEEMEILYKGLMKHGHKNFAEFQKLLPDRSLDNIKCFMRTVYDTAVKSSQGHHNIDAWINRCSSACLNETPWKNSSFVAKIMKYLSVDGLLENHPLPERCNGINFSEAYRVIYQALMGYPIQPVNEATCDFVIETLKELVTDATVEKEAAEKLKSFLIENLNFKEKDEPQTQTIDSSSTQIDRKPEKVYQRKRQKVMQNCDSQAPAVKIVVVPTENQECENSNLKEFVVTVENKERGDVTTVTNVAVPVTTQPVVDEEEEELVKSPSYNPLKIPKKWLQEPIYLNLHQPQ